MTVLDAVLDCRVHVYLRTYFLHSLLILEHKSSTRDIHLALFCVVFSIDNQVIPYSLISTSTLLDVPFGLPGFLFPGGVHFGIS